MKRTVLFALGCLLLLPTFAAADQLDDMIAASQQELANRKTKEGEMVKQWPSFEKRKSDIEFAWDAAQKQEKKLGAEIDDWKQRVSSNDVKAAPVEAQIEALNAQITAHNHPCTEQCDDKGNCDGSCAAWVAEGQRLNAASDQLQAQYAPIRQEREGLKREMETLKTNANMIEQIKQTVSDQTLQWTTDVKQFKADWDDNEAQIKLLQDNIAKLLAIKAQTDTCIRAIPDECNRPDTPILNTKCENMVAQCRAIWDGSRP